MYLPLTYTLLEVDAAIALDREAMTIAVATASLLNIGRAPFAGEPLWLSHTPMISPPRREGYMSGYLSDYLAQRLE